MLLVEDLLLLLTDDTTGRLAKSGAEVDTALAGALLVELAMLARIDVTGPGGPGRAGRIVMRDPAPTGDALLDGALETLRGRAGTTPKNVLGPLAKGLRQRVFDRLVERRILRAERGKVLGLFPTLSWPTDDARHEEKLRTRLRAVLIDDHEPDDRTGALVALLHAVRAVPTTVDVKAHGTSRRDLARRAKEIADGNWGSKAVRQAIDEMVAAVMTAAMVPTTSAAVSS